MFHLEARIDIESPASAVFRLLCDPVRMAELNPRVEIVSASVISSGVLGTDSRIHYSLRTRSGLQSFHCTVTTFEQDRVIEMVSDTQPPFRLRQSLEPALHGCTLVHEEWLRLDIRHVQKASQERPLPYLLRLFQAAAGHSIPSDTVLEETQYLALRAEMQEALSLWLINIKMHLETSSVSPIVGGPALTA